MNLESEGFPDKEIADRLGQSGWHRALAPAPRLSQAPRPLAHEAALKFRSTRSG
jgi:hypothetical protein